MQRLAHWLRFNWLYFGRPRWDTGTSPSELIEFIRQHPTVWKSARMAQIRADARRSGRGFKLKKGQDLLQQGTTGSSLFQALKTQ